MWYLTLIAGLGVIMLIAFALFIIFMFMLETFQETSVLTFAAFWVMVGILLIGIGFFGW
jgi:hypothetical protein